MFNFNNMIKYTGINRNLSLTIVASAGKIYLTVWDNTGTDMKTKRPFTTIMTPSTMVLFKTYLNKVINAGPGARHSILLSEWNPQLKKFGNKKTITLGKDDNKIIYIAVSGDSLNNQEMFMLKLVKSLDTSPDTLTDDQRSIIETTALLEQIDDLRTAILLSRDKDTMSALAKKWSNNGGNNNFNNNNNVNNNNVDYSSTPANASMDSISF